MSGNNRKTDKSSANKEKWEKKQAEIRAKKEADPNKTYVGRGTKTFQKEQNKERPRVENDHLMNRLNKPVIVSENHATVKLPNQVWTQKNNKDVGKNVSFNQKKYDDNRKYTYRQPSIFNSVVSDLYSSNDGGQSPQKTTTTHVNLPRVTYGTARKAGLGDNLANKAAQFSNEYTCATNYKDLAGAVNKSISQAVAAQNKQVIKYEAYQQQSHNGRK